MSVCYTFTPLDTLFFRGNIPMEAGYIPSNPLFPPPVSVISGAVRTAVITERGALEAYINGNAPELEKLLGKWGSDETPFAITAILIKKDGVFYAPAPALWYIDAAETQKLEKADDYIGKQIITAKEYSTAFDKLGIKSSEGALAFVVPEKDAHPLRGCWVSLEFLQSDKKQIAIGDILLQKDIFSIEARIGIALDEKRVVQTGKLYSAHHIRLRDGITFALLFDKEPGLAERGTIPIGGETRFCVYKKDALSRTIPRVNADVKDTLYISLVPVEATAESVSKLVASQKPLVISGWDLAKGFHKPSKNWLPAGAVFQEKISPACIPLGNK
jgi:CRISPR-associated protein Cmr3